MLMIFAAVMVCVSAMVFTALDRVGHYANQLDEERSREAVTGAVNTFRDQLSATLHDYAAWDDAFEHTQGGPDLDWLNRNVGNMTHQSELFDVAIVLDQDGKPVMAYSEGRPVASATLGSYVTQDVWRVLRSLTPSSGGNGLEGSGFATTIKGVAAVSVGVIRPRLSQNKDPGEPRHYMLLMRHLNGAAIERLARAYVLPGLHMADVGVQSSHRLDIVGPAGQPIAALGWISRSPGDASLAQVRPLLWCAVAMIAIFMLLLLVSGVQALSRLSADEAAAVKLSLTDRLSGLPNRAGLFAGMAILLDEAQADGKDVALLYLDLDGFKEVNDAYGHATGDTLIRSVSAGLRVLVGKDAVLARLGGDEFAVAFIGFDVHRTATEMSERIIVFLSEPINIGERVAVIGCSIGLAVSRRGLVPGEELIRRADMAMYRSKEDGRGRWTLYDPSMDEAREERNLLELDLRAAIDRNEITVAYQPIVDAHSLTMCGVEALARWNRRGHGPVQPDVFIPIAESTGLIDLLGLCVMRTACLALARWPGLTLSVNVSPGQFRDPSFVQHVSALLQETDVQPARLTLEMTETYFVQNPARARQTLNLLRSIGVKIALDDFGSGFSSVGYLRQFGFDRLKIDRSLVQSVGESRQAVEMLHATVALARSLDMPVTAEGVETEAQTLALQLAGCELLQGFLFGTAMPPTDIDRLHLAGPLVRLSNAG